ncbi:MAG: DUF262 domain-containing protein [Clostridiales bacterium]|nr:DUF262 domain-containing protein [Clostridiales bacterium]
MKADNILLLEFIGASKRTFYIPVYQRNYDWKASECMTLFKDIEAVAKSSTQISHFLGTIVYVEGDSSPTFREFTVIDGQQRLTTIMILLKAIVDSCDDEELKEDIVETYLINRRCSEKLRIKLKPMKSDAKNFQKLIDNQYDSQDNSPIFNNYKLFIDLIEKSSLSAAEVYNGIQRLEIVYIELDHEKENPQLIFESLNSTGLDLTQADLIRNYLLMGQEYHRQEELYNKYWSKLESLLPDALISDFIRDYLTLKRGSIPNKADVYIVFKKYYEQLGNYDSEGFLEELTTYGQYYHWFKYCDCPDNAINVRLRHLQKLKSTVVYPFLLSVFEDCYMYGEIDNAQVCDIIDVILSYVVRRLLCEIPTNALNKVFATMAKDMEHYADSSYCTRVVEVLASKAGKAAFPNDKILKEHLLTRNAYKFAHIKFVLEQIERRRSNKETVSFDSLTIEHIMPQTLSVKWRIDLGTNAQEIHEKYVHCIGNLTLSGYNSELSNSSFDEKKQEYSKSNVSITRSLGELDHWGEHEILNRGNDLIKDIEKIWPCPDIINNANSKIDDRTEFDFFDEVDVTGRQPRELEIIGETYSVSSWREFLQTLCTVLYEYDPQIFRSLTMHNDFKGKNVRMIATDDQNMHKPLKIADGIYVEANRNANNILNYCKLIIEKFDGVEEESSYKLKGL